MVTEAFDATRVQDYQYKQMRRPLGLSESETLQVALRLLDLNPSTKIK